MKVFIIDDEIIACKGIESMLNRMETTQKLKLYSFTNPLIAFEKLKEINPDIIITDLIMPEISGVELIKNIKDSGYEGKIIVISGNDEFNVVKQCFKYNIEDYLLKPVLFSDMKDIFSRLTNNILSKTESNINESNIRIEIEKSIKNLYRDETIDEGLLENTFSFRYCTFGIIRAIQLNQEKNRNMLFNVLSNIDKLESISINSFVFNENDILVAFMFDELSLYNSCVEILKKYYREVCKSVNHVVKAAIGECFFGDQKYSNAVKSAKRVFTQRLYDEYSNFYSELSIPKYFPEFRDGFVKELADFENSLSKIEENKAKNFIKFWFDEKKLKPVKYDDIEAMYKIIIRKIEAIYNEQEFALNIIEYKRFYSFSTLSQIRNELYNSVCAILKFIKERKSFEKNIIDSTIKYINTNFSSDISLTFISNQGNLSYSYFSRLFKSHTGISFSKYLLKVRMENAQKLLSSNNGYKIYDIARMVGYDTANVQNFTRAFRKYFGKSPTNM